MTKSEEKYKSLGTEEKIAENVKKIKGLFKDVSKEKRQFVNGLVYQFAVCNVTLERLVDEINEGEILENFEQGSQKFKRESPAVKSYNATVKSFTMLSKSLMEMLPETTQKRAGEELLNFASKPPGAPKR